MRQSLGAQDPRWMKSLPKIVEPDAEDSLPGFLLKLDQSNALGAGTTWRIVRTRKVGGAGLRRTNALARGRDIDFARVAEVGALSYEEARGLTALPLIEWLYPYNPPYRFAFGLPHGVCPACVEERRVPLLCLFPDITGCQRHGLLLQDGCSCGRDVDFFHGAEPFHCGRCTRPLSDLNRIALSDEARGELSARVECYRTMLERARSGAPGPHSIRRGLRVLARRADLNDMAPRRAEGRLSRGVPALAFIVDVLVRTAASLDEFLAAARDSAE